MIKDGQKKEKAKAKGKDSDTAEGHHNMNWREWE